MSEIYPNDLRKMQLQVYPLASSLSAPNVRKKLLTRQQANEVFAQYALTFSHQIPTIANSPG